jgi:hypothetical protein
VRCELFPNLHAARPVAVAFGARSVPSACHAHQRGRGVDNATGEPLLLEKSASGWRRALLVERGPVVFAHSRATTRQLFERIHLRPQRLTGLTRIPVNLGFRNGRKADHIPLISVRIFSGQLQQTTSQVVLVPPRQADDDGAFAAKLSGSKRRRVLLPDAFAKDFRLGLSPVLDRVVDDANVRRLAGDRTHDAGCDIVAVLANDIELALRTLLGVRRLSEP